MATQGADNLIPTNIFINHLDTYISSHTGKVLLKSVFGSGAVPEEADEGLEEGTAISTIPDGFNNNIYCTLSNPQAVLDIPAVVISNKMKLLTYVVASGVAYGEENDVFHPFFKAGWLNNRALDVIDDGSNLIPTIHVKDLASIVCELLNMCPTTHYILAVDDSHNTLLEIVTAISKSLTTGRVRHISIEETKKKGELTQKQIDNLTLNLRLEAQFVHENMSFKWTSENGIVLSVDKLVREFKLARGLLPIRICVLGPPLSGKSKLAQLLSEYYSVPHIHAKGVIEDSIKDLKEKLNPTNNGTSDQSKDTKGTEEEERSQSSDMNVEDHDANLADLLEEIQTVLASERGRLNNAMICRLMKRRLSSKECSNQGYILDGFPKTKAQATLLFGDNESKEEGEEEEGEGEEMEEGTATGEVEMGKELDPQTQISKLEKERATREGIIPNATMETAFIGKVDLALNPTTILTGILPSCIIFLQASDVFLISRALQMPPSEIQSNHNDEEGFLRRLTVYRRACAGTEVAALMANDDLRKALESESLQKIANGEASSLLPSEQLAPLMAGSIGPDSLYAFFEDKGVRVYNFDIENDMSGVFDEVVRKIQSAIGPPRNYGRTSKTTILKEQIQMEAEEVECRELENSREAEEFRRREVHKREFSNLLEGMRAQEAEALLKASRPLREFLAKFVMPTLTKGIFECIWRRPEDPVDYLAEYLFRNNAQID
ncbi:hypothetical protein Aperf_G00000006991 [Anoplocephala perfoliata]